MLLLFISLTLVASNPTELLVDGDNHLQNSSFPCTPFHYGDVNGDHRPDLVCLAPTQTQRPVGPYHGAIHIYYSYQSGNLSLPDIQISEIPDGYFLNAINRLAWAAPFTVILSQTSPGEESIHHSTVVFPISRLRGRISYSDLPKMEVNATFQDTRDINSDGYPEVFFYNQTWAETAILLTGKTVADYELFTLPTFFIYGERPMIQRNALNISRGETVVLTRENLQANGTAVPTFAVAGVQHGHFEFTFWPGKPIVVFDQFQLDRGEVTFTHDGTIWGSTYWVQATNLYAFTEFQAAKMTFDWKDKKSTRRRNAILLVATFGLFFFCLTIVSKWLENRYLDSASLEVEAATAHAVRNAVRPVSQHLFSRVRITPGAGFARKETIKGGVVAVIYILNELERQGVEIDLRKMSPSEQLRFMNAISVETRTRLVKSSSYRGWFCPETTPSEIQSQAREIAAAVKRLLKVEPLVKTLERIETKVETKAGTSVADATPSEKEGVILEIS